MLLIKYNFLSFMYIHSSSHWLAYSYHTKCLTSRANVCADISVHPFSILLFFKPSIFIFIHNKVHSLLL